MKRVVVIGSKPNALIPDGEAIYCANVSIVYYAEEVARFSRIVNIITPKAIDDQTPQKSAEGGDSLTRRWERALTAMQAKLIILRSSNAEPMIDSLRKAGYDAPITIIEDQERRKLVARVSGCDDPILTSDFFYLPTKLKARYAGSVISISLKRLFDQGKTCNPVFRPSTGIISLLVAIDEHGPDCEYVVAGIGMKNRSVYIHTERSSAQGASTPTLPHHVFVDRKILRRLASRYRITTTEPELMEILPQFSEGKSGSNSATSRRDSVERKP